MERDRTDAESAARAFVEQQFPDCLAAIVAGSAVRGQATAFSDLDIVLLLPGDGPAYKETFDAFGWTIEAFTLTDRSFHDLLTQQPRMRGAALPTMCVDGLILRDTDDRALGLREEAKTVLAQGPDALSAWDIDNYRFIITSYLDDLAGSDDPEEWLYIVPALADKIVDLTLAYHRRWGGDGKSRLTALRRFDRTFAQHLSDALASVYCNGERSGLTAIADTALDPVGGRLHGGFAMGKPG